MTTYVTKDGMIDRFGQEALMELTDRSGSGAIDDAVLNQALADAASEIDGYLSCVFILPLSSTPPRLAKLGADIARYELYGEKCPDLVRARYTDAIAFLKMVAAGTASLGIDAMNHEVVEVGGILMKPKMPVFSADALRDY
jgi:phage gp36-like protein